MSSIHLYRPHRTPGENLEAILVAREPLITEIIDKLKRWQSGASRQHYLIIGPRGIGKSYIVRIIEHRIHQSPELRKKWYPLSLTEESYKITKLSDLFLEALSILSDETQDRNLLDAHAGIAFDDNDERVIDFALDALRNYHKKNGCGILLMLENVNRLFEGQMRKRGDVHLLRKVLIEEEWLNVICTSPTFLNAVTEPEEPLFDFFHAYPLNELTPDEQLQMIEKLAVLEKKESFLENLSQYQSQVQALYHFTGGNPRLTIMLYDLVANHNITDIKSDLDHLLDQLTPFYQDRMKDVPEQEAKLLEIMALMHEGATPTELARKSRMQPKLVRTLMLRLEKAGYIRREQRRLKKTVYIIPERFFRIWHQMNHSRSARGFVHYLLEFFSNWYSTKEERDKIWDELDEKFMENVQEGERQVQDVSEFMMYISAISKGSEKYEREFDRIGKMAGLYGKNYVTKEFSKLDEEFDSDGDYWLRKGYFLASNFRMDMLALLAFQKSAKLKPKDIEPLFNQAVALDKLGRKNEAYDFYCKTMDKLTNRTELIPREETLDKMLQILRNDNNPSKIRFAALLLGRVAEKEVIKDIIVILKNSKSATRRQHCVRALGFSKSYEVVGTLIKSLRDEEYNVRRRAATALGRIGSDQAVVPLIESLRDEAHNVRGSAAKALGRIGSDQAVDPLIASLRDEADSVRTSAVTALGRIGADQAVVSLIESLKDEAYNVRRSAAMALWRIGSDQAVVSLIESLRDEGDNVRDSAVAALGQIGSDQAVVSLIASLRDEAHNVRMSAAISLGQIGSDQAVDSLIESLKDEVHNVRGKAAMALGRIGSDQAVSPLIECLKDEDPINRRSAVKALVRIGSDHAVSSLIECLKDEDPIKHGSAATALARIIENNHITNLFTIFNSIISAADLHLYHMIPLIRTLLKVSFRACNLDNIIDSINHIKSTINLSDVFYIPYNVAIEYLNSGKHPAIIERQHPEVREAVQLLVGEFEKGSEQLEDSTAVMVE